MHIYNPLELLTSLFITATAVAGIAVLWRTFLNHHPRYVAGIKKKLDAYDKILLCGSCFTFWISLVSVVVFNPLDGSGIHSRILHRLFSWMSLGFVSVWLRFSYVLIQEKVHVLVHSRDNHSH